MGQQSQRLRTAGIVVLAWTLVVLAWTPPTILVERGAMAPLWIFIFVFLGFVPWMLATPFFIGIGRRFPVTRTLRNIGVHVLTGFVAVPVIVACGFLTSTVVLTGLGVLARTYSAAVIANAVVITSLYSIPTYVAVVAIVQALMFFENFRARERLLARAQLQALQAQINPHFLFNTLNAISMLGYRDPALADKALTELSDLMRAALKEGPDQVSLREEIAFAQSYSDLCNLVLPKPTAMTFDIDSESWRAAVPRMLLQPLIENAIVHGISSLGGGCIALRARVEEGKLRLELDNDCGTGKPTPGAGIGLANARERLRVLYGQGQSLSFARTEDFARVVVVLPFAPLEAG